LKHISSSALLIFCLIVAPAANAQEVDWKKVDETLGRTAAVPLPDSISSPVLPRQNAL